MIRDLSVFAVIAAVALSAKPAGAGAMAPPHQPRLVEVGFSEAAAAPMPEARGGSLRLQGDRSAIQLAVRQTMITDVLAALAGAYKISYSSAIALDEEIDGTYAGPLRRVLSRLLAGYNYVIRQENASLDLVILERSGARAVPAPTLAPLPPHRIPVTTRISRNR